MVTVPTAVQDETEGQRRTAFADDPKICDDVT